MLYEEKCLELESANLDFEEFKELTKQLEAEFESENQTLKHKVEELNGLLESLMDKHKEKEKTLKQDIEYLERENEKARLSEKKAIENCDKIKKRLIKIENEYDAIVDQIRMKDAMIDELERKVEDIVERFTILEMEKQMLNEKNKEEKQRLQMELDDARDALTARNAKQPKE